MRIVARLRSLARPLFLAGGLLLLTAPGLMAAWVPALSGQIDDRAGVLGSGQADVQRAFDELKSGHRVTMWFVTMTTTDGQSIGDMAETAFTANDLGPGNMVLIVAVADRTWGYWDQATGISTSAIDGLLNTNAGPRFAVGDYAGGVIDFVTALGQRMSGSTATAQKTVQATAGGGGSTAGGGSIDNSGLASVLWITIGAIVILSGLILLMLGLRSRHREHLSVEERNKQTGDLARKSNTLLVDTDSAVHEAQQEVGFAEAEFDESDVKPYSDAVAAAQVELKAAFAIRQQLDDSIPEDQPTKEKMYGQIIAHCQTAGAMMDEQAKRLAGLRDLEKNAPETLAALPKTIEALQSRLPSVKKALDALSAYPPASWASVKGNAEEADKQGHFAETQIVKGQAALALTSPDKAAAARAAR
ncbi:MAG TPA: TPM domain-containing protein, partial [Candidatus Limnocylindrales bacterium]